MTSCSRSSKLEQQRAYLSDVWNAATDTDALLSARMERLALQYQQASFWEALSEAERVTRFFHAAPQLGIDCPKIRGDVFDYPDAVRVRGARARADIARGETFCVVPVHALLSEFTIRNSTLSGLLHAYSGARTDGSVIMTEVESVLTTFVLREGARATSPWMPYIKAVLDAQGTDLIPATWKPGDRRLRELSPYGRILARRARARCVGQYERVFPSALTRFANVLSEGLPCAPRCGTQQLGRVYSFERFLRVYSVRPPRALAHVPRHPFTRAGTGAACAQLDAAHVRCRPPFFGARRGYA